MDFHVHEKMLALINTSSDTTAQGLLDVVHSTTENFDNPLKELWNNLPDEVKHCDNLPSFRKNLKTHLFKAAYDH